MTQYLSRLFISILVCGGAVWMPTSVCAQTPPTHQHSFSGAQQWAQVFDDPARDAWQMPHQVIGALGLKPDASVADIGAGTGYFAIRLAHMLPQGRVYGVDTEPDMVKYLAERASALNLSNLTAILAAPDDPHVPAKLDLVLFVDVYHHVENRLAYLQKLRALLKPNGRIAVIDFRMDAPVGPPKESRISAAQVKAELQGAGFVLAQQPEFLPNQFFLIFQ